MADTEDMGLDEIQKRLVNIQAEAKTLAQRGRGQVLGKIVEYMNDFDITLQDIERAATKPAQMLRSASHGRAKYEDPETGLTWTGRGKAPKWLREKEAKGISRETLLIRR